MNHHANNSPQPPNGGLLPAGIVAYLAFLRLRQDSQERELRQAAEELEKALDELRGTLAAIGEASATLRSVKPVLPAPKKLNINYR